MAPFGKIYSFMLNGRVFKILAAAKLNGLEVELAEYQHMTTNKTAEFRAKFPAGKVPAFEGADGFCLAESDAIAQYVAQSGPRAGQLLGRDATAGARVQQWICFADGEVTAFVLDLVAWRVGLAPYDAATEARALGRLDGALAVAERHLRGRAWLAGDELSLADLTLASALVWAFRHIVDEESRRRYPSIVEWCLRTIGVEGIEDVFGPPDMVLVRREYAEP